MIVAATGHRPEKLGGYGTDLAALRTELAMEWLHSRGATRGITGLALGWDQDVALACYELGIPYIAAVPFAGQESRWPERSQRVYRWFINRAAEVVIVSPGEYSAHKMQVRNIWMADRCDTLLALYNGSGGGTGNCIKYAADWEIPVENIWKNYSRLAGL